MSSKRVGLPLNLNPEHTSRLYDGTEYREFWAGKQKASLDELEHALVRELLPISGRRMIDIGCGYGRLADCYLDRFEQVVMLDGSITLLQQARERLGEKAVYIAADANHLPLAPASFDCALMIRVLHHLKDAHWTLSELSRILGHGGVFLFDYSNKLSARQLLRRLLRWNKENPLVLEPVMSGNMLMQHHPADVQRVLKTTGFSNTQYFGTGVVDKLVGSRVEKWLPSGRSLAPLFGLIKLAPWIMCRTHSSGAALKDYRSIDDLFICPTCQSTVRRTEQAYVCISSSCNSSYPIENGIADFRPSA